MEKEIILFISKVSTENPVFAYIIFFINAAIQVLFPPYPGDTIIIFQGYISSLGILSSPALLSTTLSATYLSSIFLYLLSYKLGHRVLSTKFIKKFIDIKKIYSLEGWFKKYGSLVVISGKFIPGLGFFSLIAAGLFELPPISAFISIGISTLIHNTILFMAGRITGNNMDIIKKAMFEYNRLIIIGVLTLSALYIYTKYIYKRKFKEDGKGSK